MYARTCAHTHTSHTWRCEGATHKADFYEVTYRKHNFKKCTGKGKARMGSMPANVHTQHTIAHHQWLRNLRFDHRTVVRRLSNFCPRHEKKFILVNLVSLWPQLSSHLLSCKAPILTFKDTQSLPCQPSFKQQARPIKGYWDAPDYSQGSLLFWLI